MILAWLARRRRARLLAGPFPPAWDDILARNVPLYARLADRDRARVRDDLRVIVAEKAWVGCGGLAVTDEVKVTIAAHAALLLVGVRHDYFARVGSVLVYPSGFRAPDGWARPDGTVGPAAGALGEAWYDGPVVLAWDAVLAGARDDRDGRNVVIHEFAHQLDYLDGVADGTPPLRSRDAYREWREVMTREYDRLCREAGDGTPTVMDGYGATSHAEFFAVASEAFFERPRMMWAAHPALYQVLSGYYNQDPASREPAAPDLAAAPEPTAGPTPAGRPGYRASRAAAKAPPHAAKTLDWPGWVRFWEIHPGVSRAQALWPLDQQINFAVISLLFAAGFGAYSRAHDWQLNAGMFVFPLLTATMAGFAVWLRLAVRWVDRHGVWGGGFRPGPEADAEANGPGGDEPANPDPGPAGP